MNVTTGHNPLLGLVTLTAQDGEATVIDNAYIVGIWNGQVVIQSYPQGIPEGRGTVEVVTWVHPANDVDRLEFEGDYDSTLETLQQTELMDENWNLIQTAVSV